MTREEQRDALLQEAKDNNDALQVLVDDHKWNSNRLSVLEKKMKLITTEKERDRCLKELREIQRRRDINLDTKAKLDKKDADLAKRINAFFGRTIW